MGISQSNPSSSTQIIEKKKEVFLNFRGIDTRNGFTNYLYEALSAKSIETFMDEEGIEKGEEIWPKLLKTIRDSMISVVIFSKEYASSKWPLRELVEILKSGQTVIPVFYNVAVYDVRRQEGSFKDGFDQLKKRFEDDLKNEQADSAEVEKRKQEFYEEMQQWRQALEDASRVKGWHVKGPESKLIDEIVKDIWEKLMRAYELSPCDYKRLFGFQERLNQVKSLLCLDKPDIQIIGIWGMGGIGKTTIADAIFKQISTDDEYGKCFIRDVRQRLGQCTLVSLLQEVLSEVLNVQNIKLDSLTFPQHIKNKLCRKKVFIVLDDVDDFLKLQELAAGLDQLGPGSRIIITTRNRDIFRNCRVNDDYIYEVKGLSYPEAFQLFRACAQPTEDCLKFSREIVWAINGNPLGLIVAGSSLSGLNKLEWQSALSRIKKSPKILEMLQISYDGLEDEDKHTFLDIACFFVGEREDYVVEILGDCYYSLKVLYERSLVTISNDKIIQMHDLLQEMGREIVCKESLHNPGNRSRLWTQEDIFDTLKNANGTNAIRGIFLNMSIMNKEYLNSQAFKEMKNLRFLKFYDPSFYESLYFSSFFRDFLYSSNVHFPNDINYLSNKLRSLNWLGYPWKALPSNFAPENLVELNLRHSNVEQLWEDNKHAPKLKWIILKACPYLISISDLLNAPLLEKVDIDDCQNLLSFPSPVRHFNNLRELNLRGCSNLRSFPNNISFPSLVSLDFSWCINLAKISDFLDAPLLEVIDLYKCESLLDFPPPVHHFNNLRELNLRDCENLRSFPNNIPFPSLVSLDLSGCINLGVVVSFTNTP